MGLYGGGGNGADEARQLEAERQARIRQGMAGVNASFAPFNERFYDERAKAYVDTAMPDVASQYRATQNNLGAVLARRGLLKSSAAVDRNNSLAQELMRRKREVVDAGQTAAGELRGDVESQRQALSGQVLAGGDPNSVAGAAAASAAQFRKPTAVAPIGNLFADWTDIYLGNQAARAYNPSVQPMFQWGGGGRGSSSRIVDY